MSQPTATSTRPNLTLLTGDLDEVMEANRAAAAAAVSRMVKMSRAVIYARASQDADRTGLTTAKQIADGTTYAEARDLPVVHVYKDDGKSAWKPGVVRHEFERLLADAQAGLFDVVIVRHTDRLYRQLAELPRIVKELAPHAHILAIHEGPIDLSTAAGIMMAQIKGAVAEHESRLKSERVADNARHRAHNGRMVTGNRPFGWAWQNPCPGDETCEHKQPHAPNARPLPGNRAGLTPHPTEALAVEHIYRMVADGKSLAAAARWLNAEGYTGTGGARFRGEYVRQVLAMPRQCGLVSHGDYTPTEGSDKQRGRKAGDQNLVSQAKDGVRIVEPELWQNVQRILSDKKRRTSPGRPANTVLSGIARCGRCDGPMNASNRSYYPPGSKGKGLKPDKVVPVYICGRNLHLSRVREHLDRLVLDTVSQFLLRNKVRLAREATPDSSALEVAAQREVDRLRSKLDGYAAVADQMDPTDYVAAVNPIRAALTEAEGKAVTVSRRPGLARLLAADDVAADWGALCTDPDTEGLRVVLRELIESVTVDPGMPLVDHYAINWQPWLRAIVEDDAA